MATTDELLVEATAAMTSLTRAVVERSDLTKATEAMASAEAAKAKSYESAMQAGIAAEMADISKAQADTSTSKAALATSKAAEAAESANNASVSAASALVSASSAAAIFDSFDDRYLGAKTAKPAVDNDGNALLVGALYWDSQVKEMRVWDGSAWSAAYIPSAGYATLTGTQTLTNKTFGNATVVSDNSASAALTITQAGTGNALVVNDATGDGGSTPLERMRITSTGSVGINQTAPAAKLDVSGNQAINIVAMAALDVDCTAGNYFTKTINGNSTFTVSNVPASRAYAFTLELTHTSGTVTWFSGVQWPGGTAPTLTTGKTHLLTFVTNDGGTRWRGVANTNYTT